MSDRNFQPHKYYSRLNPHMYEYLAAEHLSPSQMRILNHFVHIMTRDNLAECPKDKTMQTHLTSVLAIHPKNLPKLLKPMKDLEIYIPESVKAWRINPFIANKKEFLSSLYGFSRVSKLTKGFAEWVLSGTGSAHVSCESYQKLIKGYEETQEKKDIKMSELLYKIHLLENQNNQIMNGVNAILNIIEKLSIPPLEKESLKSHLKVVAK